MMKSNAILLCLAAAAAASTTTASPTTIPQRADPLPSPSNRHTVLLAHGILASLAFILLFPLGSIILRLLPSRHTLLIHGIFQLLAYAVYAAAFALGMYMVNNNVPDGITSSSHFLIGIALFVLLLFQPVAGYVHHRRFKRNGGKKTGWAVAHVWLGRVVLTLGMLDGGLGLQLSGSDSSVFKECKPSLGQFVAYGVGAGVMWVLWVGAVVLGKRRAARVNGGHGAEK